MGRHGGSPLTLDCGKAQPTIGYIPLTSRIHPSNLASLLLHPPLGSGRQLKQHARLLTSEAGALTRVWARRLGL